MAAAPGLCVSFFTQGCPHHCKGCHNPETWSFTGGKEFTQDTLHEILEALDANGISRSLCIMGGEPLCEENVFLTNLVISYVKDKRPQTKIYVWTGYTYEELLKMDNTKVFQCLKNTDVLIDGPYIEEQRDVTLLMRGSTNQRIIEFSKNN